MKCGVQQKITIKCVTYVQKDFKIQTLIKQLLIKNQIFMKLPQISHIHKIVIFKYNWNFLDQLLVPYKFNGRDMLGMYFIIFASCEPLML